MNMKRNWYRSKASQINKRKIPFRGSSLAGDQGFEPQFPRPERGVLPLHQSPKFILTDPESAVLPLDEPPLGWHAPRPAGGIVSRHERAGKYHLRAARRVLS